MESRQFRLDEFFRRLQAAPVARDYDEAFRQIEETLNQVEDEFTAIPYDPENWATDGRMYPPQEDSKREVPGFPGVFRFRSRQHNTYLSSKGAIEISRLSPFSEILEEVIFRKSGANELGVWDHESN